MSRITDGLNALLADYSVFYQKLRGYHWNVKGPMFFALHEKFEELYTVTAQRVDEIAERVATLGDRPLSTLKEYLATSRIVEDAEAPAAEAMVANVRADLETLNAALRELGAQASEDGDDVTEGYVLEVIAAQEMTVWMLGAYLGA